MSVKQIRINEYPDSAKTVKSPMTVTTNSSTLITGLRVEVAKLSDQVSIPYKIVGLYSKMTYMLKYPASYQAFYSYSFGSKPAMIEMKDLKFPDGVYLRGIMCKKYYTADGWLFTYELIGTAPGTDTRDIRNWIKLPFGSLPASVSGSNGTVVYDYNFVNGFDTSKIGHNLLITFLNVGDYTSTFKVNPIDCKVSPWYDSYECINGKSRFYREVLAQAANGGKECPPLEEYRDCGVVDCKWGPWSEWSECSPTLGTQSRTREMVQLANQYGKQCEGKNYELRSCPVDCKVGEWGDWSGCEGVPEGSENWRRRKILVHPRNGGKACPPLIEKKYCPIHCKVSAWGEWIEDCPNLKTTRTRTVTVQPQHGGNACPPLSQTGAISKCAADCNVGPWSDWTTECVNSQFYRTREVTKPTGPGGSCVPLIEYKACVMNDDPTNDDPNMNTGGDVPNDVPDNLTPNDNTPPIDESPAADPESNIFDGPVFWFILLAVAIAVVIYIRRRGKKSAPRIVYQQRRQYPPQQPMYGRQSMQQTMYPQ